MSVAWSIQNKINLEGLVLTVNRRPATVGAPAISFPIKAFIKPLGEERAHSLAIEGSVNISEATPHEIFILPGCGLQEATDTIIYNGFNWRVLTVIPVFWKQTEGMMYQTAVIVRQTNSPTNK